MESKVKDSDILTLEDKERFRRRLLIASRVIAVLLILAIIWIGYVQMTYAKDIARIKEQYGSLGYCYLCGLENYRLCECQYKYELEVINGEINYTDVGLKAAEHNIQQCPNKNKKDLDVPNFD